MSIDRARVFIFMVGVLSRIRLRSFIPYQVSQFLVIVFVPALRHSAGGAEVFDGELAIKLADIGFDEECLLGRLRTGAGVTLSNAQLKENLAEEFFHRPAAVTCRIGPPQEPLPGNL